MLYAVVIVMLVLPLVVVFSLVVAWEMRRRRKVYREVDRDSDRLWKSP